MKKLPLPFRPLALFILLAACRAHGDSATWTGADGIWETLGNWSGPPAAVPGASDTATFSATGYAGTGLAPINAAGTVGVTGIIFGGTAQDYRLTGTINLSAGGSITANNGNQAIASTYTETPAASGIFVPSGFSVTTAGSASFTNTGTGTLSLGVNSVVAGSTLTFDGSGAITALALANLANTTAVVKNGNGTVTFSSSNSNVTGGFTFNAGTSVALNQNGFSNKVLNLNGGTAQMNINATANYTGTVVSANSTLAVSNPSTSALQWTYGATAAANLLSSTGTPVLTFRNASTTVPIVNNYISMNLTTSGFNGTWKLGDSTGGGLLFVNSTNAVGGTNVRVDIGDAGSTGVHVLGTSTILTSGNNVVPVVIGELKGTLTTGVLAGRRNQGTRSTGTRFEVGAMGTDTTFSGIIADGVSNINGARQMNGNPDCTASVAPDTVTTYLRTNGIAGAQGTVEFVKTGAGTLTLLSNNTHTGGTILQGGVLAVSGDGGLGATYDGSLRPFTVIIGTTIYSATDLPDASLSGGNPATPAAIGLFSSQFGQWGANREYISFSSQNNDTDSGNITNTQTGTGYKSLPTVSFTGGTVTTAGTDPLVTVRVKGLLTFDGGTLKTNAGITSNRAVVLAAGGGTFNTNTFDSTLSGVVNGTGSLTKTGTGKLAMTGLNTYTGDTLVTLGTLAVNGTSIGNAAKLTITGGKVEVVANETVGTLYLGADQKAAGTYGAFGSGATNINDTYFTGSGVLTVAVGPVGGYVAWASTNAGSQTANLDYDNDGVQNGTEYFMNSAPGFTANPGPVGGAVTWINGGNIPSAAYGTQFVVQTSSDLVNWTPVLSGNPNLSNTAGSVIYNLTGSGSLFARLVVTPN